MDDIEVGICPKHKRKYIGLCMDCEREQEARQDAAQAKPDNKTALPPCGWR